MVGDPPRDVHVDLGPDPVIDAFKKDIDRTLIRENLRLTPDERLKPDTTDDLNRRLEDQEKHVFLLIS